MLLERYNSTLLDMYSEVWYVYKPSASGGIDIDDDGEGRAHRLYLYTR